MRANANKAEEYRWGYAVAGAVAIGCAALTQFAFDDLRPDTIQSLPAAVSGPYSVVGKLALTAPLAALGVVLVARDLVSNRVARPVVAPRAERERPVELPPSTDSALSEELDLETGEPLAEELEPTGPKIPALRGRFSWLVRDDSYNPGARRQP